MELRSHVSLDCFGSVLEAFTLVHVVYCILLGVCKIISHAKRHSFRYQGELRFGRRGYRDECDT